MNVRVVMAAQSQAGVDRPQLILFYEIKDADTSDF
jgi:hypothetical protein